MSPTSNTKMEIMSAIGKTDDHNLKMVLLLMLGIMEEIGGKIDRIYDDKQTLRESVLNGHADVHHSDHEWIRHRREEYDIRQAFMARAEPVVGWVEAKIESEKDTKKLLKQNMFDKLSDIGGKVLWIIAGMVIYAVSNGWLIK